MSSVVGDTGADMGHHSEEHMRQRIGGSFVQMKRVQTDMR
jgi:hypothetical protein